MSTPECIAQTSDILGEAPLWSSRNQRLYWVDIQRGAVHAYDPSTAETTTYTLPEVIGSFCERQAGGFIVALKSGYYTTNAEFEIQDFLLNPEPDHPGNRPNDGKCDRQGRFWVGTMPEGDRVPSGALHCLDDTGHVRRVLENLTVPNSLCWSPDGRQMYFTDTPTLKIMAYDFDTEAGVPHQPRVFRDLAGHPGKPDGSTVDADGCLWNAEVNGGRVVRYTPQGDIDRIITLPVQRVTSCAFGGPRLDTLFITTAREGLTEAQLVQQPLAGSLFAVNPGATGIPETPFRA